MTCVANYDRKVVIQSQSGTVDAHGFKADTWTQYAVSFASIKSRGGREFWKVDQVNADVSHVWRCPYDKTLAAATPDMQLVSDSLTYEIVSVIDIDLAHEEVEIQTKRAV